MGCAPGFLLVEISERPRERVPALSSNTRERLCTVHRLLYHSTLGLKAIKTKKKVHAINARGRCVGHAIGCLLLLYPCTVHAINARGCCVGRELGFLLAQISQRTRERMPVLSFNTRELLCIVQRRLYHSTLESNKHKGKNICDQCQRMLRGARSWISSSPLPLYCTCDQCKRVLRGARTSLSSSSRAAPTSPLAAPAREKLVTRSVETVRF